MHAPCRPHLAGNRDGGSGEQEEEEEEEDLWDNMFIWNSFMTASLRQAVGNDSWALPLIHGSWEQRRLSVFGKTVSLRASVCVCVCVCVCVRARVPCVCVWYACVCMRCMCAQVEGLLRI
jgi:hypothetical protein